MMGKFSGRGFRAPYGSRGVPTVHYCPETGEEVFYHDCARCEKFGVYEEGDISRCVHEHEDLKKMGFYAKTEDEWLECLRDTDYETYCRLLEEKRERERVLAEMEGERSGFVSEGNEGDKSEDDEKDADGDDNESEGSLDEDDDEQGWW